MRIKRVVLTLFFYISLVLSTAGLGHAYSGILAFGDSLSDNGYYEGYSGGTAGNTNPADIYGIMRFSNGPVWVEYMTAVMSIPLFDMAYGGATTGYDNPAAGLSWSGLNWQVDTYLALYAGQISSNTLVTVWAGANDLFQGRPYDTAADNVSLALAKLANAGFQNFLVLNLPDIGATPQFNSGDPIIAAGATAWSNAFNMDLAANLLALEQLYGGANFYTLDIYSLFNSIMANPQAYGFTDVNDIFWFDGLHPSTKTHMLAADYAMASVPEPATLFLLVLSLLGIAGIKRKFQK